MMQKAAVGIFQALLWFYTMVAMEADKRPDAFLHSHRKWLEDFHNLKSRYDHALAQRMWDYLILAAGGEARHGGRQSSLYIKGFPTSKSHTRSDSYDAVKAYDPKRLRQALIEVFSGPWTSGYGGERWKEAVIATYWYDKLPPAAFIDHVADTVHNNGTVFNKSETGIFYSDIGTDQLMRFLDWRRHLAHPYNFLSHDEWLAIGPGYEYIKYMPRPIVSLINRGKNIGILSKWWAPPDESLLSSPEAYSHNEAFKAILNYTPIEWGTEVPGAIGEYPYRCYYCEGWHETPYEDCYQCDYCGEHFDYAKTKQCPHCHYQNSKMEYCPSCNAEYPDTEGECPYCAEDYDEDDWKDDDDFEETA